MNPLRNCSAEEQLAGQSGLARTQAGWGVCVFGYCTAGIPVSTNSQVDEAHQEFTP